MTQRRNTLGERLGPRAMRWSFNHWPAIRNTGMRVQHIADNWSEIRVKLPLSWRTRNYVGTIFGGSMYGAVDPFLMLMLMRRLGHGYVVWDKAASIRFRRPAKSDLFAHFHVTDVELAELEQAVDEAGELDRTWTVHLVDSAGVVHAEIDKVLYVARRDVYEAKVARRAASESA